MTFIIILHYSILYCDNIITYLQCISPSDPPYIQDIFFSHLLQTDLWSLYFTPLLPYFITAYLHSPVSTSFLFVPDHSSNSSSVHRKETQALLCVIEVSYLKGQEALKLSSNTELVNTFASIGKDYCRETRAQNRRENRRFLHKHSFNPQDTGLNHFTCSLLGQQSRFLFPSLWRILSHDGIDYPLFPFHQPILYPLLFLISVRSIYYWEAFHKSHFSVHDGTRKRLTSIFFWFGRKPPSSGPNEKAGNF